MYTSELFYGGIKAVNVLTGTVQQVVPSFGPLTDRAAIGLTYFGHAIFAAGAGPQVGLPAAVHVYDATTGADVVSCVVGEGGFFNDLLVVDETLYVTDSTSSSLYVFDAMAMLKDGICDYHTITLPDVFAVEPGVFGANGIEVYKGGLIIAQAGAGELWYMDLTTLAFTLIYAEGGGDGLLVDGDILYACEANSLAVYKLDKSKKNGVTAEPIADLTSELFDSPATVAMYKKMLYIVNAVGTLVRETHTTSKTWNRYLYGFSLSHTCSLSLCIIFSALEILDFRQMGNSTLLHLARNFP